MERNQDCEMSLYTRPENVWLVIVTCVIDNSLFESVDSTTNLNLKNFSKWIIRKFKFTNKN